jgi:hypothetical protein
MNEERPRLNNGRPLYLNTAEIDALMRNAGKEFPLSKQDKEHLLQWANDAKEQYLLLDLVLAGIVKAQPQANDSSPLFIWPNSVGDFVDLLLIHSQAINLASGRCPTCGRGSL